MQKIRMWEMCLPVQSAKVNDFRKPQRVSWTWVSDDITQNLNLLLTHLSTYYVRKADFVKHNFLLFLVNTFSCWVKQQGIYQRSRLSRCI